MPFFLDTQETVQRFGSSIAEFHSLLDTNHLRHGSPDDLFPFAKTLEDSNQFRMDLSALVNSVVRKEREELLLTDMMSIIATAVAGPSVTETTVDLTRPTNTLMEFLLGTGCWKQFGSPSQRLSQRAELPTKPVVRTEEPEPIRIAHAVPPVGSAAESPEEKSLLREIANDLRQTLSRLESNTQQVKLHLDSMERRIGGLERSPHAPPADKAERLEPLVHHGAVNTAADIVPLAAKEPPAIAPPLPTRGRALFAGAASLDESSTGEEDDFSAPTFEYGTGERRSLVPIAIVIVLAAIAAAVFFYIRSARSHAPLAGVQGDGSHLSVSAAPSPQSPAVQSPAVPSPASTAAAAPSTPSSPTGQPSPDGAAPNASSATQPSSNSPKIRYVPANVMEGYLLSAPRPEYPAQARIGHIEGQVALQAVISKSGAVMALHAIKGPSSLQNAAVAAVRTWRYKPYSIDGQAEDVATTVYVDFTLTPPPAIVH